MYLPVSVNEFHCPGAVRVLCYNVSGKDVPDQIFPFLRLQLELERVADCDGARWPALVHDHQAHSAVQGVFGGEVLNWSWLTGPE